MQLYTAFFLSGLSHSFGDLALGLPFGASMPFFLSQAVVITFEDALIAAARRLGVGPAINLKTKRKQTPRRWGHVLGYIWVFVRFSYSLRLHVWRATAASFVPEEVPFSIVQTLAPTFLWVSIFQGLSRFALTETDE